MTLSLAVSRRPRCGRWRRSSKVLAGYELHRAALGLARAASFRLELHAGDPRDRSDLRSTREFLLSTLDCRPRKPAHRFVTARAERLEDTIGFMDGQRPKDDSIQQREYRHRSADRQGQRSNCHESEARARPQCARGIANILRKPLEPTEAEFLSNILFDVGHVAELPAGRRARSFRRQPFSAVVLFERLQMRRQLLPEDGVVTPDDASTRARDEGGSSDHLHDAGYPSGQLLPVVLLIGQATSARFR